MTNLKGTPSAFPSVQPDSTIIPIPITTTGTYANAGFVNPNATGPIIALPATPSSTVPVGTRCPSYPVLRVAAITSPDR